MTLMFCEMLNDAELYVTPPGLAALVMVAQL